MSITWSKQTSSGSNLTPGFMPVPGCGGSPGSRLGRLPLSPIGVLLLLLGVNPALIAAFGVFSLARNLWVWLGGLGRETRLLTLLAAVAAVGLVRHTQSSVRGVGEVMPPLAWWGGLFAVVGCLGLVVASE